MLSREQETLDYVKEHKLEGLMTQLIELATYHQVNESKKKFPFNFISSPRICVNSSLSN